MSDTVAAPVSRPWWRTHWPMALVMALAKLQGVEGRAEVLDLAVTAEDEDQARFLAVGLSLLAREHEGNPLKAILDGKPVGMTRKGRVVATMPVDYVSWTELVAAFASREDLLPHRPSIMITGRMSARTRTEMQKLGWEIREQAPLTGTF